MENNSLSPRSSEIIDRFKSEFQRAQRMEGEPYSVNNFSTTPSDQSFVRMIQEMMKLGEIAPGNIAEAILTEKLLQKRLEMIDQESKLKIIFPTGYLVQPAVIPFTYYGHELTEDEIRQGAHLVQLIKEKGNGGRTVGGYSQFSSYIHKLFPEEFEGCQFEVPEYDEEELGRVTTDDRERIKDLYQETFHHLQDAITEAATRTYQ